MVLTPYLGFSYMEVGMVNRYERAELLTAIWKLGASDKLMPTSHGILDRALSHERERLPAALSEGLTFSVTGVGLRCLELPEILLAAQEAMLTSEPNPTYLSTVVTLDEEEARQIVLSYGIATRDASEIGERLREAVERERWPAEEAALQD
jgi:hypothetical protein